MCDAIRKSMAMHTCKQSTIPQAVTKFRVIKIQIYKQVSQLPTPLLAFRSSIALEKGFAQYIDDCELVLIYLEADFTGFN